MSWEAQGWVIKQNTGSASNKWVLMVLASFCDENNECFPSFKTICRITELGRSTVIRCLKDLERKNFIEIKERYADFNDAKRQTSNLYTLKVGYQIETNGYHKETPPSITKKPHITNNKELIYTNHFIEWWNLYPRQAGSKKKAFEIYQKITDKVIGIDELYSVTVKYKQSVHNTEPRFIPHPTTWLNGRRWEVIEEKQNKPNLNQLVG